MNYLARIPIEVKPEEFVTFDGEDLKQSIVNRFENQVVLYPERMAVKQNSEYLSYRGLNRAANQLAYRILEITDLYDEPVAFLLEQGISQIVAILGIMKAGKAYVGLDPEFPRSRLEFMLSNTETPILVTNSKNLKAAFDLPNSKKQIINLDEISSETPTKNPGRNLTPESIASIQYTSGSTGEPKGVILTHKLIMHHIMMQTNRRFLNPNDRYILLYSASFGASVGPVFGALLNGACLYPYDLKQKGLLALVDFLKCEKITIYSSVPSTFRYLVSLVNNQNAFPHLRLIIMGGDAVLRKDVDLYKENFLPNCYFEVSYAGTEFYGARTLIISRDTPIEEGIIPVGFAIADKEILLLDENGDEVPIGDVGEITVRSQYISPGYWHRPDLTEAAFVTVPGQEELVQYRTGDLGRMRSDGCLEHLGRKDRQVKIRGYRVELAEITSALLDIPNIEDAFVKAHPTSSGEIQLVAYLVPLEKSASLIEDVSKVLNDRLPTFMLPSKYMVLDELPKTPSGKVDALALQEPEKSHSNIDVSRADHQDPIEKQLVEIWETLLDTHPVGIKDDFFELGGHSLLAMRLIAEIEDKMGKTLPFPAVVQTRTIEEMTKLLKDRAALKSWSHLVALQPSGSKPAFFCVPPSAVTVMIFKDLAKHLGEERPFYGLEFLGMDTETEVHKSIHEMARYNLERIRSLQPEGPYFLGGMCFGGLVAFEMAQQLAAEGEQVPFLGVLDSTHAPYLSKPRSYPVFMITRFINRKILRQRFPIGMAPLKRAMKKFSANDELGKRIYEVFSTHNYARMKYITRPYLGPITLFNTAGSRGEFSKVQWQAVARGKLEIVSIPGVHSGARVDLREGETSFIKEPHVQVLAQKINECLENAGKN